MRILGIIGLLCFILTNSVILNLFCVWIYAHEEDQTDKHEEKSESEKSDCCLYRSSNIQHSYVYTTNMSVSGSCAPDKKKCDTDGGIPGTVVDVN